MSMPPLSGSKSPAGRRPTKLPRAFFARPAIEVARGLIGAILVRRVEGRRLRARIVETEAYVGPHDLACHAAKGRTARTEVMFGPGGRAYVYLIYGLHDMLNVVTGPRGHGEAVLLRAAQPLGGWEADLGGPGRLAKALGITRADNGLSVTSPALHFLADSGRRPRIEVTKRIGIDYAGPWKDAPLRFLLAQPPLTNTPRAKSRGVRGV